ncbi:MAG: metallophosphoesterase [Mailhella sp.]|nr:metallophosphoesterase [Mailhella sp.]
MRLLLPSVVMTAYIFFSLVWPLRISKAHKAALGILLLTVGMKYIFYEVVGGSFFRPILPVPVLLVAEALYASLVILFFLALLKDLTVLLCRIGCFFGKKWHIPATAGLRCAVFVAASLCAGLWGTYQAVRVPDVRTVEVRIENLPVELEGFSLVQLSDIHIGPLFKNRWLSEVVEKANTLSPALVVITGDFIDGLPDELRADVQPLEKLRAKFGVFGVEGNHENYYNAPGWRPVFTSLGITMLSNEHRVLPGGLVIGGVTDRASSRFGRSGPSPAQAFAGAPASPRILLAHQPYLEGILPAAVDLQLSGHTHGGSLFFLAPLIAHYNGGYVRGLYTTENGQLYVSSGTGLWAGFSCRLGVPSEITQIILKRR